MLDVVLLVLKIGTLLLLFLFIYWIVRSARRDLSAGAAGPGRYAAAATGPAAAARSGAAAPDEWPQASWARAGLAAPAASPVSSPGPGFAASAAERQTVARRGAAPRLVVVSSPTLSPGAGIELGDVLTFGRAPESDVVLEDPFVSSTHARVVRRGQTSVLEDLGSTNGTFVNERAVREAVLTPETRLRVGETVFRYEE